MRKRILQSMLVVILCLGLSFGMFDGISFVKENMSGVRTAEALCANGIQGNGLGGISININSGYYASYANVPTYGQYAYTTSGCAWFASARVRELTGKGSNIYGGSKWYNTIGPNLGFTRGSGLRAKAVACWSNHVAIVEAISGNTIYISEGGYTAGTAANGYTVIRTVNNSYFSSGNRGTWLGFVYLGIGGTVAVADNVPQGVVDYVTCTGPGKIVVRGWAFDRDNTGVSLAVHVYIGNEAHVITANKSRPDVNAAYPGVGNYHGFEAVIESKKSGNQSVVIYAINIGKDGNNFGNGNSNPSIGKKSVFITTDTTKPKISSIKISNITRGYYTVTATATDNIGVKEVRFATWSSKNGQDDLKWISGTKMNHTTWQCKILASDHNMESGEYITHVYAYDDAGNSQGNAAPAIRIPDVTENKIINTEKIFEARIANIATGYYFYLSEKTIIDGKHGDLVSRKHNEKDAKGLQKETWIFSLQSDGYYTIQNKYSGKYLDIAYSSKNPGTNVILSDWKAEGTNDNQKFRLYKSSKGYYIVSKCTPYTVLDIKDRVSGTSVYTDYYEPGNADQIFNISKPGEAGGKSGKYGTGTVSAAGGTIKNGKKNVTAPGRVKCLKVKNKKKRSIFLTWKKVSGVKGYQIQYAANKKFKKKKSSFTKKKKYTVKKVKKNKILYFRVRAYRMNGKKKVYGKWSKVKKVKIKK